MRLLRGYTFFKFLWGRVVRGLRWRLFYTFKNTASPHIYLVVLRSERGDVCACLLKLFVVFFVVVFAWVGGCGKLFFSYGMCLHTFFSLFFFSIICFYGASCLRCGYGQCAIEMSILTYLHLSWSRMT